MTHARAILNYRHSLCVCMCALGALNPLVTQLSDVQSFVHVCVCVCVRVTK